MSLSSALERHPKAFGELYVNIVRAGEATGRVDQALDDLVQQLEWQEATRTRVREAAAYPLLIVGLLTVLLTVLVGFTIPRFARVYASVNANLQLPLPTRVVQAVGHVHRGERPRDRSRRLAVAVRALPAARADAGRARVAGPVAAEAARRRRRVAQARAVALRALLRHASTSRASRWRRRSPLIERVIGNAVHRAAVPRRRRAGAGRRLAVARPRRRRRVLAARHPDGGARREDGADVEVAAAGASVLRPRSRPCGEPRDWRLRPDRPHGPGRRLRADRRRVLPAAVQPRQGRRHDETDRPRAPPASR